MAAEFGMYVEDYNRSPTLYWLPTFNIKSSFGITSTGLPLRLLSLRLQPYLYYKIF